MIKKMKLKGIVSNETFRKLLHDVVKNVTDITNGEVKYWTAKSVFLAKKKGVRYWEIYQLRRGAIEDGDV